MRVSALAVVALSGVALAGAAACSGGNGPAPRSSTSAPASPSVVPGALAFDAQDQLLVADPDQHVVLRFGNDGRWSVLARGVTASAIAVGPGGRILVADATAGTLTQVDGAHAPPPTTGLAGISAVAVTRTGVVYAVTSAGVVVMGKGAPRMFLPNGAARIRVHGTPTAMSASAVATTSDGRVLIADFSPKLLIELNAGHQVTRAWDVYVSPGGGLGSLGTRAYVADFGSFTADVIAGGALSQQVAAAALGRLRPVAIAVARDGTVVVDDDGRSGASATPRLVAIRPDKQVVELVLPTQGDVARLAAGA
jgi:hypothetical protein